MTVTDTNTRDVMRNRLVDALRTIERLQGRVEELESRRDEPPAAEPIAVVGLGCRMPRAGDPTAFWKLLRDGVDATREFPSERGDARALYDEDPDTPGKAYVIRGAFIDDIDLFEPTMFGISPREAVGMDPQQRVGLEVSWEALENAGYAPDSLEDTRTGVYVGVSTTDYVRMRQEIGDIRDVDAYQLIGEPSFVAGRIAYTLGLQGPTKVVDTTCSSSLVAVHEACQALRLGECDMAIAGGVNAMLSPYGFVLMSKFRALSPDGRCKTFDARADGYARGEGVGFVVLKRLSDARADRDNVVALVRGSAVNHDGRSSGMTVPNPLSQQAVIRAALAQARIDPGDVDYVEAHGTGTALGDPIELRSLEAVLGRHHAGRGPLLVGSVKTNIGHLESAAGIAGLLKLVLALQHRYIPPHLHFERPNPNVEWDRLHIEVAAEGRPWPEPDGRPRVGAVSSFGASGTNAHAVVSEAPAPAERRGSRRSRDVLVLSAKTESALRGLADRYARHLRDEPAELADVCFTARAGRAGLAHGLAVAGESTDEIAAALAAFARGERDERVTTGARAKHKHRKTAWLFTGQGSQYAGMGCALYEAEPAFRAAFDRCVELFDPLLDRPLRDVTWRDRDGLVDLTRYTQPALFALEYSLAQLWSSWGLRPAAVMGHSIGEIVAATVAGVMELDDAVRLVAARARLMSELPPGGVMLAVRCDEDTARAAIGERDDVSIAAVNGPADVVVSGAGDGVEDVARRLSADGVRSVRLTVSHAFHSPLMRPMLDRFRAEIEGISFRPPKVPLVSNVSGRMWSDGDGDADYWVRHVAEAVRFHDGLTTLHSEGVRTFLEIGPTPVLTGLGARNVDDPDCAWIASLRRGADEPTTVLRAAGALRVRGVPLAWERFEGDGARRVPLPTYPWERERYWFPEAAGGATTAPAVVAGEAVAGVGRRLECATPTYELAATDDALAARAGADGDVPAGALLDVAFAAAEHALDGAWTHVTALETGESLRVEDGRRVQVTVTGRGGRAEVSCSSATDAEDAAGAPWREHLRATLARVAPALGDERVDPDAYDAGADGDVRRGDDGVLVALRAGRAATRGDALDAVVTAVAAAGGVPGTAVRAHVDGLSCASPERVRYVRAAARADGDAVAGDADLVAEDGCVVGRATGVRLTPAGRPRAPWRRPDELLYALEWHDDGPLPSATSLDGRRFLLLRDDGGVADDVARALEARGASCTVAAPDPDPAAVGDVVDGWRDESAPGGHVVVLAGLDAPAADATDASSLRTFEQRCEHLVIAVVKALHERGLDGVDVSLVTRGAVPAGPGAAVDNVAATTLWGLARVIVLEHPEHWGVAVDLDPGAAVEPATLATLLAARDGEDQQAVRAGRRYVARLVPRRPDAAALHRRAPVRADGTYLVTGGLGGIGLELSRWLARHGAGRLVLTSRKGLPPRERWDDADVPAATRAAIEAVRDVEALGTEVEVVAADAADDDAMTALVARLADGPRPLRGVVHAAGVSIPQFVRDVSADEYHSVWRPKVLGGWLLHRLTAGLELDFFLTFSSIASVWGSQHLASYAAANAFLDGLAFHRRSRGLPALTVAWGPWELASALFGDDVMAFLESVGLRQLSAPQCLRLLGALLAGDDAQQVVCAADWSVFKPVMEARVERPMLRTIEVDDDAGAADGDSSEVLDRLRAASDDGGRAGVLVDYLRSALAETLALTAEQIEPDSDVMSHGLDSLMVMEIVNRCKRDLHVRIRPNALFERTTVTEWATFLAGEVEGVLEDAAPADADAAPADAASDADAAPADAARDADAAPAARVPARRAEPPNTPDRIRPDVVLAPDVRPAAPLVERTGPPSHVLLTGGTGFVGAFLLHELLAQTDARISCLVRCRDEDEGMTRLRGALERYLLPWRDDAVDRIVVVRGDLAQPLLGVGAERFEGLARELDAIYHNGAWVNFSHTYHQLWPANVTGTEEIFRLACTGPLTPVHYVSTYGIWGIPTSDHLVIREDDDIDRAGKLVTGYVQTKWAAERLTLLARERGIPVDLYRPGRVLGDARTGACLTTHFTCRVIKGCVQLGLAPIIDIEVEMTPADYVARALVHISADKRSFGDNYHLVNTQRMTFHDLMCFVQKRGWNVEFVDRHAWWDALQETLGERENELHYVMDTVEEFVVRGEEAVDYDTSNATAALEGSGITCPPLDEALLDTYFDFFIRSGYLEAPGE
ncbi:MAG TPA: thioester reductase domain-containing protein [Actinomycetota bacterium]|nr:thioester reductase domain-containing protein [Actinomycetota bacterium]